MVCISVPIFIDLYELGFSLGLSPMGILWLPSAVLFFLCTLWVSRCISLGYAKRWRTMGTLWRTENKFTFLLPGLAQDNLFTMILKKQINFCKVYAYVGKTWKDQWKRKVRIENLLNFDMCSPIHIHIHQQSVEALLQVYEHAFEPSRCLS